jgi:hypothetical protein
MPRNYDSTDLLWTSRGDFYCSNGDIVDTYYDPLRSLYQETKDRASSDQGAWAIFPTNGSSISDFVGEPNNKITAEAIKTRIISSLTRSGYIDSSDIDIKYIPVSAEKLLFRISIRVLPTSRNAYSDSLKILGLYTYREDQVALFI